MTVLFLWLLLAAFAVAATIVFWPFLRPALFAAILAVGMYPLHGWMLRRIRLPSAASALSTIAVLVMLVVPAGFTIAAVGTEMASAGRMLSEKSKQEGGARKFAESLVQGPMAWAGRHHIDLDRFGIRAWAESLPLKASTYFVGAATLLLGGLAGFAGQTIITFFVLFFLFRDGPELLRRIAALLPLNGAQTNKLFTSIQDSVIANLYGILAVALVQGALTGIALAVLGIPSALMLGVLTGLASLVPIVGTALVWLPASIYLLATAPAWKGIALLLWGSLVVGTSDNVVRPLVVKGRVELHPLIVMFAILGGLDLFGFIGIFLGPMILSVLAAVGELLRNELHAQRREEEEGTLPAIATG